MTPERIGKYPVERRLGGGGMGSLYLARHPDLGHLVAIKTLKADYQDDPDLRERFLREARSAAQLAHPNIVKVHDFVADATHPFIVMEFIDGDTLGKRLRSEPPLTLEQTLTLFDELCSGLAHAHAAGIVHRDIKPANLMLDHRGVLRILDFGIARLGNSGMTLEGMMMGSVNYMSPEQVVGRGVDSRSDIFAAGAVMYEVLTLEKAFPGDIDGGALNRILHEGATPISQKLPGIDPELAAIVERALQRDVEARYRSADAMGRDLAHVRRRLLRRDSGQTVIRGPEDAWRVDSRRLAELKRQQLAENLQAGAAALARRQFDEARRFAERAIAVDPTDRLAHDLYDQAQFAVQAEVVREHLDAALTHLAEGRIAEADAAIGGASVTLPNVAEAVALRKQVRDVSEKVAAAREREQRIGASLGRARASMEQGGYDTALRAIYEVLALDPDRAEARELESDAKARLQTKRDIERAERAARTELRRARDLIGQDLFDSATAVISVIEPPSDSVRAEVADALAAVEQARQAARVSVILADVREALTRQEFEGVLATLAALDSRESTPEVEVLRTAAQQGIERAKELERKCLALGEGVIAVQQLIDGGDLAGALGRLEEVAALELADERIGALRHRIADLGAQEHQRRLQEALDRQAERRVDAARQLLSQGQEHEAIALLERDEVEHPAVQKALLQIRDEVARRELARQQEKRQRIEEEEERRRREEAARLAAVAVEARQLEEERAVARQRAAEERRLESERQRLAEEERRRTDEARQQVAAEEARGREAARRREEEEQRRQEAERLRRAEEARMLQEAEALRLAEAERQRQAEQERQRREEERRREEAVTLVVTRVSKVMDHSVALAELREAATLVPNDPRIVTLIRQREEAIEAKAATERARAAQQEAERERETQRQRDVAAAQADDRSRQLFAAGHHEEALSLLRAAAVHPTVSATLGSLEGQLKEIERARVAHERRVRRAATLARVKGSVADRRIQAVGGVLVAGVALALVLSREPATDIGGRDSRSGVEGGVDAPLSQQPDGTTVLGGQVAEPLSAQPPNPPADEKRPAAQTVLNKSVDDQLRRQEVENARTAIQAAMAKGDLDLSERLLLDAQRRLGADLFGPQSQALNQLRAARKDDEVQASLRELVEKSKQERDHKAAVALLTRALQLSPRDSNAQEELRRRTDALSEDAVKKDAEDRARLAEGQRRLARERDEAVKNVQAAIDRALTRGDLDGADGIMQDAETRYGTAPFGSQRQQLVAKREQAAAAADSERAQTQIRSVLDRFAQAYNAKDDAGLAATWPSVPRASYRNTFNSFESLSWVFNTCAIDVVGVTATARCSVILRRVDVRGRATSETGQRRFTLHNSGGWRIEDMRAQ